MNASRSCTLSIIIVSWNVWPLLKNCLHSIEWLSQFDASIDPSLRRFGPDEQGHTLEVIVIDNASSDATCTQLPSEFPWVRLFRNDTNLGFTKANNLGYAQSRGQVIYFLNPDTELSTDWREGESVQNPKLVLEGSKIQNSLWLLYQALHADPTIGLVGPQLRYGDGSWQNSRRHFPTPLTGFFESTWLGRAWPNNLWVRHLHMIDQPADSLHDVDWLVGAAMMVQRAAIEQSGDFGEFSRAVRNQESRVDPSLAPRPSLLAMPFDEGFFMYSEEMDLCKRIKQAGWRVIYLPTALVVHHEGKSSEQVVAARHIYFNTSKVRYWRKWFGPLWAEGLRHYLLWEFRTQMVLEWLKAKVGHKRELRMARMDAYRRVIQSQLKS